MPIQLVKLALKDPSNNEIITSVVQEGGEGATRQVYSSEPVPAVIEDGQAYQDVHDFTVSLAGLYTDAHKSQLDTWLAAGTVVDVSGYTVDDRILQGSGYIGYRRGFGETYLTNIYELNRRGQYGYGSNGYSKAGLVLSLNGMALYGVAGTSTGDNFYGWTGSGAGVADGVMSVEDGNSVYRDVYFPFQDVTVSFQTDVEITAAGTTDTEIEISGRSFAGTLVGTAASQVVGSTGSYIASKTLPSGTKYIRCYIEAGTNEFIDVSVPMLVIGTTAQTYTEF